MFYSMRHEYVSLAREACCGLAVVTVEATLEEALTRNRQRIEAGGAGVPDDVITKMNSTIQWCVPLTSCLALVTCPVNGRSTT